MTKNDKGYIGYYGLGEFWNSLTTNEQNFIKYTETQATPPREPRLLTNGFISSSQTKLGFLNGKMSWAMQHKLYTIVDKIINEIEHIDKQVGIIDLHFYYNHAIDYFYKLRNINSLALEDCISYCKKDIAMFDEFKKVYIKEWNETTLTIRIPSFQRLVIIYTKLEKYNEAISICKIAIKHNLKDGTKGGFKGRLDKLQRKLL